MGLAELFLAQLEKTGSVLEALTCCDRELKERLQNQTESEAVTFYYFGPKNPDAHRHFQELMEFWKVYRRYRHQVSEKEKEQRDLFILECVYEVDGISHIEQCRRILGEWGREERKNAQQLSNRIGRIFNSKYICFFQMDEEDYQEQYRISLGEFGTKPNTFGYFAVLEKLLEYMEEEGTAVVVSGSKGLTPRRLEGYRLSGRNYRLCSEEETAVFRERALAPPPNEALGFYPKGDSGF